MRHPAKILLLLLVVVATAMALAGPASAKTPCWQTLIDDWYDGRIDSVYPVDCYRDALEHMPEDVAQYSTLEDDINRALAAVIAAGKNSGGPNTTGGGGGSTGGSTGGTTGSTTGKPTRSGSASGSTFHGGPRAGGKGVVIVAQGGRDPGDGPIPNAIGSLGPDSPDSVPVPLIVLGALSLLLLALGSAGFVARKVQTRRMAVRSDAKG